MEHYIKNNVSDITYRSELTLDISKYYLEAKCQGFNSPKQLVLFLKKNFRKLWAH